jgi:hypothetical protein
MKRLGLLALLLVLAGCGFGPAEKQSGGSVTVTVSTDFGRDRLAPTRRQTARKGETVMRLLQRSFDDVETRFGGNFVQEIDGVSGGREDGRRADWFYYVNGIESSMGAGERKLYAGDRVWWDHHDWETAMRVPAVVGAFPEPFRSGQDGKKLPIRLVCMGAEARSCDEVEERLGDAGVRNVARSNLESSPGGVLRILVGKWSDVRKDITSRQLEEGPEVSGVFAKPAPTGASIALIDPDGKTGRTLGPGAGLVAATSYQEEHPTWLITGTDDVGVAAAAAALNEDQLRFHFALAIDAGRGVPLPLES